MRREYDIMKIPGGGACFSGNLLLCCHYIYIIEQFRTGKTTGFGGKEWGKFHLVYYISMGTPSIEASLQMAETYLAHGVSALQFDLPSRNPYRETLFIRKRMAKAWGDLRRL